MPGPVDNAGNSAPYSESDSTPDVNNLRDAVNKAASGEYRNITAKDFDKLS